MKANSTFCPASHLRNALLPALVSLLGAACVDSGSTSGLTVPGPTISDQSDDGDGFECPDGGSISGALWNDLNCDGEVGASEFPIEGITVVLQDLDGSTVDDQVTDQGGYYYFEIEEAGTYRILVDAGNIQEDFEPCAATTAQVALTGSACNVTRNFGFRCSGVIGDRVWFDEDEDGLQDAGEPGLEGIRIVLKDSGGVVLGDVWSGPEGLWSFAGLAPGNYEIEVDPESLPPAFDPTASEVDGNALFDSNGSPAFVELTSCDEVHLSVDFGFTGPSGRIGDFVWYDANGNGTQELSEGIDGVRVALIEEGLGIGRTVTTRKHGLYQFLGLPAGTYTVFIIDSSLPPSFVPTICDVDGDVFDDTDSDCLPALVTLGEDAGDVSVDFGYLADCPSSWIRGLVWCDLDHDGIQDADEPGISGVRVILRDAEGIETILSTTSTLVEQVDGTFTIPGVCPGTYTVEVDLTSLPSGWELSACNVGSDDTADSNCSPSQVEVPAGVTLLDIDFGLIPPGIGTIGDFVWDDTRGAGSGEQEPDEPGLEGVLVILKSDQNAELGRTTTDADGQYLFTHLEAGNYWVEVETPDGFYVTDCDAPDDTLDSECSPAAVELSGDNENNATTDFGFIEPRGYVGNFVWHDVNRDGDLDSCTEPGIEGVLVVMRDTETGLEVAHRVTDDAGFYTFSGISAGTYIVEVDESTLPADYYQTKCHPWMETEGAGGEGDDGCGDGIIDNICNPTTIHLPNQVARILDVDFGFDRF